MLLSVPRGISFFASGTTVTKFLPLTLRDQLSCEPGLAEWRSKPHRLSARGPDG